MIASRLALYFILATANAASQSQFDSIAPGSHDEQKDNEPTLALAEFELEESYYARATTVGKQKSLRGFKPASTGARTSNASTKIQLINDGGTFPATKIDRVEATARVSRLPVSRRNQPDMPQNTGH